MRHVRVAVIGTGFSGLGMAAQLKRHGIDDFVVIERANDVGGTWRDNTYPGAACDIRTDLYSFSFNPNPDWKYRYGRQPEILDYLRSTAKKFDLYPHILFDTEFEAADWIENDALWNIRTSRETFTADVLISGHGPLIDPVWPDIACLETFAGVRMHSARWNHDIDLAGKRIAVIGTGASAIQFVPELQKVAGQLTVFQRTPAWIVPRADRETTAAHRERFRRFPLLQKVARSTIFRLAEARFLGFDHPRVGSLMQRFSQRFLESQIADPELRAKLTPDYRIGCKRILISSTFYPALTRENVSLVTEPITSIDGNTLVTGDGTRREFDVLIAGTGFNATRPPVARLIRGRDGQTLEQHWQPHMAALHGTTVVDFPNLFLLVGPNTALGHNSIVYIIESQVDYVLKALDTMQRKGARTIEPTAAAQVAYNASLQKALIGSVWTSGGCSSYYVDAGGRNTTLWPKRAGLFRRSIRRFDSSQYVISPKEPGEPSEHKEHSNA